MISTYVSAGYPFFSTMSDIAIRVENRSTFARLHVPRSQRSNVSRRQRVNVSTCQRVNVPTCQRSSDSVILSRITEPTSGRAETYPFTSFRANSERSRRIHGRVASLLDSFDWAQDKPARGRRLAKRPRPFDVASHSTPLGQGRADPSTRLREASHWDSTRENIRYA